MGHRDGPDHRRQSDRLPRRQPGRAHRPARQRRQESRHRQGRAVQGHGRASSRSTPTMPTCSANSRTGWSSLRRLRRAADFAAIQAAGLRAGQAFARAYRLAKRAAGVADFDDLIRWTRKLLAHRRAWANGSASSSTSAPTISSSTRRRTPTPTNGRSSTRSPPNISRARARPTGAGGPCSWSATTSRRSSASRAPTRAVRRLSRTVAERAAAAAEAARDSDGWAREFRDLSIDASFRSSPPILQVVDAVIDEVGHEAMGLPRRAQSARRGACRPPRRGAVVAAVLAAARPTTTVEEGEEGWVAEPRPPLRRRARAPDHGSGSTRPRRWPRTERPLVRRRHTDPRPQPRASSPACSSRGSTPTACRSPGSTGCICRSRSRSRICSPRSASRSSRTTISTSPGCWSRRSIGLDQEQLLRPRLRPQRARCGARSRRAATSRVRRAVRHARRRCSPAPTSSPRRASSKTCCRARSTRRRKLLERLGEAARDPIEELVASALEFEAQEGASLDRFLAWFSRGDVEVKRDPSSAGNAVRVMTVHGAKGLEAPLVILADATARSRRGSGAARRRSTCRSASRAARCRLLRPRSEELVEPLHGADRGAARVRPARSIGACSTSALTRAAERLVITGGRAVARRGRRGQLAQRAPRAR